MLPRGFESPSLRQVLTYAYFFGTIRPFNNLNPNMGPEEYENPPAPAMLDTDELEEDKQETSIAPAILDVGNQEFEEYTAEFEEDKKEIATTSIHILCIIHGCKSPEELVSQPFPSEGPLKFMEESEVYQHLPDFETLVLKAVQSNTYARLVFLTYFILPQYFNMEFYEAILEEAIKGEEEALANQKNLPGINAQWRQDEKVRIDAIKAVKQILAEIVKSESLSGINQLPLQYKAPAAMDVKKLLMALELVIEHWENNLKALQENFAEKERKR